MFKNLKHESIHQQIARLGQEEKMSKFDSEIKQKISSAVEGIEFIADNLKRKTLDQQVLIYFQNYRTSIRCSGGQTKSSHNI